MAISKSTPYVRYKKDFTSSLHLGTIHIESEYLDRTQKTTIESIHGMTWHNKVVNENKELNLLSDTQLELTELEKQYWNTGEKRVSVDEIHSLEEVEPNEDGTYTYTVNSMEGEYIEIYDGINNITSTSDGLDGQFEIVYDTTEEDINGNIALDSIAPQYEITDSGVGAITGAKSTGLTLVNHITEPSKEEVVAIQEYEGQYFTIENTVEGNIKSAALKGMTLVNLQPSSSWQIQASGAVNYLLYPTKELFKANTKYLIKLVNMNSKIKRVYLQPSLQTMYHLNGKDYTIITTKEGISSEISYLHIYSDEALTADDLANVKPMIIEYQEGMENWNIPYFEGMQSVKMPVLTTSGKNLFNAYKHEFNVSSSQGLKVDVLSSNSIRTYCTDKISWRSAYVVYQLKPHTWYNIRCEASGNGVKQIGINIPEYGNLYNPNTIECQESNNMLGKFLTDESGNVKLSFQGSGSESISYDNTYTNIQIEEISDKNINATSYEPHKSSILTCNEEVELRKVGDVQDELNVLTGEIIERTSQGILNGTETWTRVSNSDRFYTRVNTLKKSETYNNLIIADKIRVEVGHNYDSFMNSPTNAMTGFTGITSHPNENWIYLKIIGIENVESLKAYLQQNPINYSYVLGEEIIKTVDLTVQNQDGSTIPHIQTQQGVTHVSTSSDGLTPVVEMSCSYDTIIKPNTTYTIKLDRPIVSNTMYLQVDLGGTMMMLDADVNAFTIKTPSTLSHSQLRLSGTGNTVKEIIVLEGNRVNDKIEYFEGMKNVENPILVVSNCPYVFGKGGRI